MMLTHVIPTHIARHENRMNRRTRLEVALLEERRLLSAADLTTVATVTTVKNSVAEVQPARSVYVTNADSIRIAFTASDPDDPGSAPTTHFTVTDTRTG